MSAPFTLDLAEIARRLEALGLQRPEVTVCGGVLTISETGRAWSCGVHLPDESLSLTMDEFEERALRPAARMLAMIQHPPRDE